MYKPLVCILLALISQPDRIEGRHLPVPQTLADHDFAAIMALFPEDKEAVSTEAKHGVKDDARDVTDVIASTLKPTSMSTSFTTDIEEVKESIVHKMASQEFPDLTLTVLEVLSVHTHSARLTDIHFPSVTFACDADAGTAKLALTGGSLKMNGLYRVSYRTVREGQVTAVVEGLNAELTATLERGPDGKVQLTSDECKASLSGIDIDFHPFVLEEVSEDVRSALFHNFSDYLCSVADSMLAKIAKKLPLETIQGSYRDNDDVESTPNKGLALRTAASVDDGPVLEKLGSIQHRLSGRTKLQVLKDLLDAQLEADVEAKTAGEVVGRMASKLCSNGSECVSKLLAELSRSTASS
ncbi:CBN-GHI-1 protein [Aphelenchoides avenae]|nr:CBN-GHI-1 protein [Aphelenchus avenae]